MPALLLPRAEVPVPDVPATLRLGRWPDSLPPIDGMECDCCPIRMHVLTVGNTRRRDRYSAARHSKIITTRTQQGILLRLSGPVSVKGRRDVPSGGDRFCPLMARSSLAPWPPDEQPRPVRYAAACSSHG
jgi:hypothetical protein